jgi:ComF family protein
MTVTPLVRSALRWLLPSPCLGCGELLADGARLGLCAACRGALRPWSGRTACCRCARPLTAAAVPAGYRCGACRRRPPAHERLTVGWSFEPPLAQVVRAFKFRRLDYLGDELGDALARAWLAAQRPGAPGPELIVPVPLPWTRRLHRGYNQAEVLAVAVARRLGLPASRRLTRPPGRRQARLSRRDRLRNLEDKLGCRRPLAGERVLLVDDVVTTGATLEAAARCLLRNGAGAVEALVVARTPERVGESPSRQP